MTKLDRKSLLCFDDDTKLDAPEMIIPYR